MDKDSLTHALRELVAAIYNDCFGAYGSEERYQGQYEDEIQVLASVIVSR